MLAVALFCLFLTSCASISPSTNAGADALPACTKKSTPFENTAPFDWDAERHAWGGLRWVNEYHTATSAVIDEYMRFLGVALQTETESLTDGGSTVSVLRCTEDDFRALTPAGPKLRELTSTLQPWRNGSPDNVSATDAPAILLEYLREFECAMKEEEMAGEQGILDNVHQLLQEGNTDATLRNFSQARLLEESTRRKEVIREQINIARPALERTVLLLSGLSRLRPLLTDIECIERVSLDLRNVISLLPEAASCAVRATDAVSPLRF